MRIVLTLVHSAGLMPVGRGLCPAATAAHQRQLTCRNSCRPLVTQFITIKMVETLRFLGEIALAFIAFAAGSELYLTELRSRFTEPTISS
jgi:Kef-type K+ transport system membrane component KefB